GGAVLGVPLPFGRWFCGGRRDANGGGGWDPGHPSPPVRPPAPLAHVGPDVRVPAVDGSPVAHRGAIPERRAERGGAAARARGLEYHVVVGAGSGAVGDGAREAVAAGGDRGSGRHASPGAGAAVAVGAGAG